MSRDLTFPVFLFALGIVILSTISLGFIARDANGFRVERDQARAELAAYKATLNSCQDLLTQRGNEIARCVDDNEEMANRLAEGIRCPRK